MWRKHERLLKQTKSEINTEKLQAAKTEAKTALVSKIGSLLGSGKLKEVEQHNRKLCELVTDREQYIDELHEKVQRMEDSHSKQLDEMQRKHQSEVANLKSKHAHGGNFAQRHHPQSQALVPDVGGTLANGRPVQEDWLHHRANRSASYRKGTQL